MSAKLMNAVAIAAILAATGAARADAISELKAQSAALKKQNAALEKRLNKLEKQQASKQAAKPAGQQGAPAATDFMGMVTKGPLDAIADDGPICWKGVCVLGTLDGGVGWYSHGMPPNANFTAGEAFINKNGNRALWAFAPNNLAQSTIGLKGEEEILPGVSVVFRATTGINPQSGMLANNVGAIVNNNGVPRTAQSLNADSSRAGQAFNDELYAGLSSKTFGTLTFGRQRILTTDMVVAYDPAGASYAFSPIGYSGATMGGGDTEDARLDNALKYRVNYGPVHFGALYKFVDGSGGCYSTSAAWTAANCTGVTAHNDAYQFQLGGSYNNLDVDVAAGHINQAIAASGLTNSATASSNTNNVNVMNGNAITGANLINTAGTAAATVTDNTMAMITAKYTWNQFKFFGGYEHVLFQNPSNGLGIGAQTAGGYVISSVTNGLGKGQNDKVLQIMWTGVKYAYDAKTDIVASYYHYLQNQYASAANMASCSAAIQSARNAACSGEMNAVSLYVDHHFTKRFDAYAGLMFSSMTGGLSNSYLYSTQWAPAAGLRYSF